MHTFPPSLCAAFVLVFSLLVMVWFTAGLLPVVALAAAAELVAQFAEASGRSPHATARERDDH